MKKIIAIVLTTVLLTLGLGVSAVVAAPGDWTMNPDVNAEVSVVGDTVTLGVAGRLEGASQPMAVHGASMELQPAASYEVTFTYDLYTWDSYNAPGTPSPGGTGYWDSFSISISQNEYWNLALSDPLNGDPLDIGYGPWGGVGFGDGTLETANGVATVEIPADPLNTNYLNVVLDTLTDPQHNGSYPSWGTIEITEIVQTGIGSIKDPTPFTPDPSGNGRAVAFDGINLYYTITASNDIYKVSTSNVPLATIDTAVLYGSLSWDSSGGVLWGGTYNGSTQVYTIDPATGIETLMFDETAFGGIAADSAYGAGTENYIDGLTYDATDNTLWLSGDACATIYHVTTAGALLGSFSVPNHPSTGTQGYNTGITVAPGGFLEIAMQAGPDQGPHVIAKVTKGDPSTIVYAFVALTTNNPGIEGIAYDGNTYAPRAVVWTNQFGAVNALTAFDVQVTRTMGYWKTHSDDAVEFLPIELGPCVTVTDAAQVKAVLKAAKAKDAADMLMGQLLAAKLNVAMGDIPPADLIAIAPVIAAADELLGRNSCEPDTGKKGADRAEATALISQLDSFNNKYSP